MKTNKNYADTQQSDDVLKKREQRLRGITKGDILSFSYKSIQMEDKEHVKVSEETDAAGVPLVLMKNIRLEWQLVRVSNKFPKLMMKTLPNLVSYIAEKRVLFIGLKEFNNLQIVYKKDPSIVPKPLLFVNQTLYMEYLSGYHPIAISCGAKTKEEIQNLIESIYTLVQRRNDVGVFQGGQFGLRHIIYNPTYKCAFFVDFGYTSLLEGYTNPEKFFALVDEMEMLILKNELSDLLASLINKAVEIDNEWHKKIKDRIDDMYRNEIDRLKAIEKEYTLSLLERKIITLKSYVTRAHNISKVICHQ